LDSERKHIERPKVEIAFRFKSNNVNGGRQISSSSPSADSSGSSGARARLHDVSLEPRLE